MAITESDVRHVAMLARLALTDDQVARLAVELSSVLGHIDTIQRLDLGDVEPTAHPLADVNRTRADVIVPGLERDAALRNAPDSDGAAFVVPAITGSGDAS